MNLSRTLITLLLFGLLSGCSVFKTTPKPPPPPTSQAQEITRAQTTELEKMGTISALVHGSPMNVEAEIQRKANASGGTLLHDHHEQRNHRAGPVVFTGDTLSVALALRDK
ncbi:putative biofilm stress and motility protein A [Serratia fonticola]|uniref:Putative biofilm stress and motility protein A n=1 Tax=Serratia fonticola TaxID=47917 RepID=A0A4U9VY49_SERFO|nr:putative biofilm stress and motility protein A [Serratia fonticola]